MADETNSLDELLNLARQATPAPESNAPSIITPGPELQAQQRRLSTPHPSKEEQEASFISRSTAPGVPLDTQTGAPIGERFAAGFRHEPEDIVKYWQNQYGQENVRLAPDGSVIVRTTDKDTGQLKDVFVDERRTSIKDVADLAGSLPEMLTTAAAIWAAKRLPGGIGKAQGFLGTLRNAIAAAFGQEAGGALRDVGVAAADRPLAELAPKTLEAMKQHGKALPIDVGLNMMLAAGGKVISKVVTPFGDQLPPIQVDAAQAEQFWKERGVNYPMTGGERTGSALLQRSEASVKRQAGGFGPFESLQQKQNEAVQQMQNIVQGLPKDAGQAERSAIPTMDDLVDRLRNALQSKMEPVEQGIAAARTKLVENANRDIQQAITEASMPERQLYLNRVGAAIKGKAAAMRSDFQAEDNRLYEAALEKAGGRDRILDIGKLPDKAADYLAKLPSKEIVKEVTSFAPSGEEIKKTITSREPLKEFVPDGVINKLRSLASLAGQKVSLEDLKSMRTEVDNSIAVGESIPGVRTHHLRQIRNMLTEGMNEAVKTSPDPQLETLWRAANQYHKENVGKFETRLVSSILKPEEAPGFVGEHEIASRIMSGADKISEMKDFLGESSPEFKMLKRGIADRIYQESLYSGQDTLNAKSFIGRLSKLKADNREVYDEVFGDQGNRILAQAQNMSIGQADKLDAAIIDAGIQNPRAIPDLRAIISAEKAKDRLYRNKIIAAIGSKSLPGDFDPAEFNSRFLNAATPKEIGEVMQLLADKPGLQWQIRAKAVEDILNEAARNPTPQDRVALRFDPNRIVAAWKLQELLKTPEKRAVYEALVGKDTMEALDNLAKILKPGEAKHQAFAASGGIAGGLQVNELWQGKILGFTNKVLHNMIGAFLLTVPFARAWTGNTAMTPAKFHLLVSSVLSSKPVMEQMIKDYGTKGAVEATQTIKKNMDAWVRGQPQQRGQPTDEDALKALQNIK